MENGTGHSEQGFQKELGKDNKGSAAIEELKLQVEYWMKRLDHTLQHTQTSTRHIYLVDGAVIAFIYFLIRFCGTERSIVLLASIPIFLLSILNFLHARIIRSQQGWYAAICERLMDLLNQTQVEREFIISTHGTYRYIHIVIAVTLALMGILMLSYGLGAFSEIQLIDSNH